MLVPLGITIDRPQKPHTASLMRGSWRVPLASHRAGTMRCMACGADMILRCDRAILSPRRKGSWPLAENLPKGMRFSPPSIRQCLLPLLVHLATVSWMRIPCSAGHVIADETMPVPGFQRHAYMCSLCHDTGQRLVFNKHGQERELETVPAPVEPASTVRNLRAAAKGFLEPVLAQIAACPQRAVILSACVVLAAIPTAFVSASGDGFLDENPVFGRSLPSSDSRASDGARPQASGQKYQCRPPSQ
jgi:hypothetical protein